MIRGYDCLSVCITYAEHLMKNEIEEYQVYFAFGTRQVEFDSEELYSDSHSLMENNLDMFDIKRLLKRDIETENSAEEYIEKHCNQQNVLIMCLDSCLLKYRNIFLNNARTPHYVCVSKYSKEDKKVYIHDGYIPNDENDPFEGWVDLEELLPAWREANYIHYIWDKSHIKLENVELAIHDTVKETISRYIFPLKDSELFYGEEAVYEWLNKVSPEDDMDHLLHQLKVRGILTMKYFFLFYLEKNEKTKQLGEQYQRIIEAWEKLCTLLFFMKLRRRTGALDNFKEQAVKLITKEHDLLQQIYEVL